MDKIKINKNTTNKKIINSQDDFLKLIETVHLSSIFGTDYNEGSLLPISDYIFKIKIESSLLKKNNHELQNIAFKNCAFSDVLINNYDLVFTSFDNCTFNNFALQNSKLSNSCFNNISCISTFFISNCNISNAKFTNIRLKWNISELTLEDTKEAEFSFCEFYENSRFTNVIFNKANFNSISLKDLKLNNATFQDCKFTKKRDENILKSYGAKIISLNNPVLKIEFSFLNDNQISYMHTFLNNFNTSIEQKYQDVRGEITQKYHNVITLQLYTNNKEKVYNLSIEIQKVIEEYCKQTTKEINEYINHPQVSTKESNSMGNLFNKIGRMLAMNDIINNKVKYAVFNSNNKPIININIANGQHIKQINKN